MATRLAAVNITILTTIVPIAILNSSVCVIKCTSMILVIIRRSSGLMWTCSLYTTLTTRLSIVPHPPPISIVPVFHISRGAAAEREDTQSTKPADLVRAQSQLFLPGLREYTTTFTRLT